ncbi:hypothetical protein [Serratia fonticola]|uniref:hypothetical protein n=1 Tax=Serratia fonticola TaxID=47917 RepID=UPI0027F00340|nr:hypothetical protein [Serratia fonticola]MDQ7207736.1 hypothetical protein [Serratia fonticola]HBE9077974.1 hypothetical protein [Serratia fonticola]HBE9088501.1 hypothetical protein [Serratia fonticola]HBE9150699.1 hypothetical protein [Serratia fonticola]
MVEFVYAVVTKTPVWVYVLFIFLLMRGIKARKPATVSLEKLAIVPAIFLLWDIYDLVAHHQLTVSSLLMWCSGLVIGAFIGYRLVNPAQITVASEMRSINRPADYSVLPLMMVAFVIKYILGVIGSVSPETLQQPSGHAVAIVSGGLFAGLFVGKFIHYLRCYFLVTYRAS